jgi:hypothetical protein
VEFGSFACRFRAGQGVVVVGADGSIEIALSNAAALEVRQQLTEATRVSYHSISEEAARLGVSEKTMRKYAKEDGCPHFVLPGGDIRLIPKEVDGWLIDHHRIAPGKNKNYGG